VQDSTAYATWYQDEPDGQYPAALGSGAAQFQVSADLDSGAGLTALANSTTQLPSSSTFYSAAQYAGLTIAFNNFDGGGASLPLAVFVRWANSAGTRYVGSRYFVVPGGTGGALDGWAEVTFQHKGAKFQVWIINGTGTNISYSFAMTQTTVARDSWTLGQLRQNAGVSPYTYPLFSGATAVVAFGTTVTLATAKGTWAGPAVWNYFFAGGTNATFFLQVQDVSGTWQTLVFKQITAAPPTNQVNAPITETVILPPHPVRVAFQNGQGAGNLSPITSLTPDEDRM
jgi:hypothetical protein